MLKSWIKLLALLACMVGLAGCSGVRVIDSQVNSYSTLTELPQPPTYRLESLPLQDGMNLGFSQWQVDAAATQALSSVGMVRDDANGVYRLELASNASQYTPNWPYYYDPFYNPFYGPRYYGAMGYGPWGWSPGFGYNYWMDRPPTLYVFEVRLTLRDNTTSQVVYESNARYEDIWYNPDAILHALFKAAVNGFPAPPKGMRTIRSEITP